MGVFTGLLLGIGLFLCLLSGPTDEPNRRKGLRLQGLVAEAQLPKVRPVHLLLASVGGALVVGALVQAASSTRSVAAVFAAFGASSPWLLLRRRVLRGRSERRDLWPYVIDDLASGIRAGLSLPEAVAAVAERGPLPMRPAFAAFAADYRSSGEIEARQSWTVNGARLAVCAPWAVLLLLASRSNSIKVYDRPAGLVVLAIGGGLSGLAYVLMRRIGRLPAEPRTALSSP
jgi:tight adherence protein B